MRHCTEALRQVGISVDYFVSPQDQQEYVYFLTHFHSDHMRGLYDRKTEWCAGKLYCSPVTKSVLSAWKPVNKCHPLPLALHCWHQLRVRGKVFHVYLLDAQHSVGSVMYMFDIGGKRVLYTGDFVWHPRLTSESVWSKPVDLLIADHTFVHPSLKLQSIQQAEIQLVTLWTQVCARGKTLVVLDGNCMNMMMLSRLQHSGLRIAVSDSLQNRPEFHVAREMWPELKEDRQCNLILAHESFRTELHSQWQNAYEFVKVSVLWFTCQPKISVSPRRDSQGIWRICASNHITYTDYLKFVKLCHPTKVEACSPPKIGTCTNFQY